MMTQTLTAPSSRRDPRTIAPYLFISPFFILFGLFWILPIGAGVYLSLTEWAGLGSPQFVGLANYFRLFDDPVFHISLLNTGLYTLGALVLVVPAALGIAVALNTRGLKLKDLFRTIYFLPVVLSPIIIALIFGLIFDGEYGLFNALLQAVFGYAGIDWLTDPLWARVVVIILVLWRWTGFLTIFFLAGLQAIPKDLYEAAEIDGAGPFRRFWYVTMPQLKPVTAFIATTMLFNTAQIFEEPFLLTEGGPGNSTVSVAMFVYQVGFRQQELGYASAAGVVMFLIVALLGLMAARLFGVGRSEQ